MIRGLDGTAQVGSLILFCLTQIPGEVWSRCIRWRIADQWRHWLARHAVGAGVWEASLLRDLEAEYLKVRGVALLQGFFRHALTLTS
jgi:hypothetical protein